MKNVPTLWVCVISLYFCISCGNSSNSDFYFTDNEADALLLEKQELPKRPIPIAWELDLHDVRPVNGGMHHLKWYTTSDKLGRELISNSVTIFDKEADAIEYWRGFVNMQQESTQVPEAGRPVCTSPPGEYKSEIADEFIVFCIDSFSHLLGLSVYEYEMIARYGNVVSGLFGVVVKYPDLNTKQATEAGFIMSWTEMETLLMNIDHKFQTVSKAQP